MHKQFVRWVAAALVSCCLTATAEAQYMTHEWVLSLGAGFSDPTGAFEQQAKVGNHVLADIGHYFNPSWLLGVRGGYFTFDSEDDWRESTGLDRITYWSTDVEVRLMLYPESWFTPYVLGGIGANLETQWYNDPGGERSEDVFRVSFTGGVGLSYHRQRSPFSLFTELIYNHYPTPDGSRQFVRWTSGLRLSLGGRPF